MGNSKRGKGEQPSPDSQGSEQTVPCIVVTQTDAEGKFDSYLDGERCQERKHGIRSHWTVGMNAAGLTRPRTGCSQRMSASSPLTPPLPRSTTGW
jgi:hypothetical protein